MIMRPIPILPGDILRFRTMHQPCPEEVIGWGVVHHVAGENIAVVVVEAITSSRQEDDIRIRYLRPEEVETILRGGYLIFNAPPPDATMIENTGTGSIPKFSF